MTTTDTFLALAIIVLVALAVAATALSVLDGGRGHAPSSHEQDNRFLPPSLLG